MSSDTAILTSRLNVVIVSCESLVRNLNPHGNNDDCYTCGQLQNAKIVNGYSSCGYTVVSKGFKDYNLNTKGFYLYDTKLQGG